MMQKRTFLCCCVLALLLAGCFGMTALADEVDTALPETAAAAGESQPAPMEQSEELPSGEIVFNDTLSGPMIPADYAAISNESALGQEFVDYVQTYIADCAQYIPVEKYNMSTAAGSDMINLIYYESPELFSPCSMQYWYKNGKVVKLEVLQYRDYADTPAEYSKCLQGMRNAKKILTEGVKGNSNLSKVEKALLLHDRLALWTEYDLGFTTTAIYSAVGPLMNQSGVCQGYALAYMYLLEEVGIESDMCSSNQMDHAWNIVYLDGTAYHVDVTWDDPTDSYSTFYDKYGRVLHDNFLRSTQGIRETGHTASDYTTTPSDTRYDSGMWWMNSQTSVEFIGANMYYRKNDGYIWKIDNNDNHTKLHKTGTLTGSLASAGNKLLFSTMYEVMQLDPATGATAEVYTVSSGRIEGFKYEKGKLCLQIYDGSSKRISVAFTPKEEPEVEPLVEITNTAGNQHVIKNTSISFTVELSSTEGVTYQWQRCKNGITWTNVSYQGNKTKTVTFDAASWAQYPFRCEITDANGTRLYTESYTYTLYEPPVVPNITSNPRDVYLLSGQTATFTVEAVGSSFVDDGSADTGVTYQWWRSKNGGATWGEYTGTGNKTASISLKVYSNQEYLYMCEVKDGYGNTIKSKIAQPHLVTPVKITSQPTVTVSAGKATFTFTATGDVRTYQWERLKTNGWVDANNATSYVGNNTPTMSTTVKGTFRCRITDMAGNVTYTDEITFNG